MSDNKNPNIKALGKLLRREQILCEAMQANGGEDEDLDLIEKNSALSNSIAALIIETSQKAGNVFTFLVNHSRSVREGALAGDYDRISGDITDENFSTRQSGIKKVVVELKPFNPHYGDGKILRKLNEEGLYPATLQDLLVLGEKHPNLQRELPIVALGSCWELSNGVRQYPYLGNSGSNGLRRCLDLCYSNLLIDDYRRPKEIFCQLAYFAGVR